MLGTIYDAHLESLLPHPRAPYVIDRKYHPGSSEISEDAVDEVAMQALEAARLPLPQITSNIA